MIRNIFLAVLVIAIAFVGYQVFDIYRMRSALTDVGEQYKSGPETANLEVVEFLDYGCPYCRQVHPTITEAVRQDGNVTYIPRPVAYLGEASAYAAVIAYGAAEQDRFFEMHDVLIRDFELLDEGTLPNIAGNAGVDVQKLQDAMDAGYLQDIVIENIDLLNSIGTNATPTFIIGDETVYVPEGSMPTVDDFLDMFAKARGENK